MNFSLGDEFRRMCILVERGKNTTNYYFINLIDEQFQIIDIFFHVV